ncbi:hypothetical protein F4859DRAFT_97861 [Xylaria cf. heliscus]|nr:hypothetical protein F4859DRAFT_97861 [Xylaria cf. heliscus]
MDSAFIITFLITACLIWARQFKAWDSVAKIELSILSFASIDVVYQLRKLRSTLPLEVSRYVARKRESFDTDLLHWIYLLVVQPKPIPPSRITSMDETPT